MLEEEHLEILRVCEASENANPKDPAIFNTGDHCGYCPGRGFCPPTSGELSAMLRMDVTAPDMLKKILPFNDLKRIIKNAETLLDLADAQTNEGVVIPGFKRVAKQSKRSYADVEAVEAVIKGSRKLTFEETHAHTLLPFTKLEALFKKKNKAFKKADKKGISFAKMIEPLLKKGSPGTKLASSDDPTPAVPGLGAIAALLERKD